MPEGTIPSVEDADVEGKRVLVRVDLNVPMAKGTVADAMRIDGILPTIRLLAARGAKTVVMSHFARPKGKPDPAFSLEPVARRMDEMLEETHVHFASDCIGPEAEAAVEALQPGGVLMLENLRFHAGEEANDPAFTEALAKMGDVYVNEAFASAHRAHASVVGLPAVLPSYAGLKMLAEIAALDSVLGHPERPIIAMVGGAKVSSKIGVLTNLCRNFDQVVVGGAMANTFLLARGADVGGSLVEAELTGAAKDVMDVAKTAGCELVLPRDAVVAKEIREGAEYSICDVNAVPHDSMILDIGPETVDGLCARLGNHRTLLWNGPLGAFETLPFGEGTFAVARHAARLTRENRLVSIAGGGDTAAALNAAGVRGGFSYVSTAGGAFLEWLEGKALPGVTALRAS